MADQVNDSQPKPGARSVNVRTFAKDVAALTGKKMSDAAMAPVSAPPSVKVPDPVPPPSEKPELDPLPEQTKETKEAVLARLRARAAAPAPSVLEGLKPPPPSPIALTQKLESQPPPIHTYKSDFAEHIDEKNASVFSVLAAEKDARGGSLETLRPHKKGQSRLIIGGMLILLGIVGVYTAYRWSQDLSIVPTEQAIPSLVFADARKELAGGGPDLLAALAEAGKDLPKGNVLVTYITNASTTDEGIISFPASGGVFIAQLGLPAPSILLRNIEDVSTVGVINTTEPRAFFILRVSSFEHTFAGMLEWEETMGQDLAVLYPAYVDPAPPVVEVATSTATTTTPVVVPPPPPPPVFVDVVVASRDARTLVDHQGRTILLYGYRDKQTLIIARDEAAFTQLVERLAATDAR